jgi:hypothetical protein
MYMVEASFSPMHTEAVHVHTGCYMVANPSVAYMLVSHLDAEHEVSIVLGNPRLLKLGRYILSLCRMGEFGGRVMYARSLQQQQLMSSNAKDTCRVESVYDTCVVVDICQWTDDMTVCMKHCFPDMELRIVHSTASLTGFSVVVKLHAAGKTMCLPHHAMDGSSRSSSSHRTTDPDCDPPKSMRIYQRLLGAGFRAARTGMQLPAIALGRVYQQGSSITGMAVCACTVYAFVCIVGYMCSLDT